MALKCYLLLGLLVLLGSCANSNATKSNAVTPSYGISSLNRSSFPKGFTFGSASASYQYEGAVKEGGKGPSQWDYYTHNYPELIADGSNGDVAADQYHRYKEDVGLMKDMGLDAYRFSISWPRLIPKGKLRKGVNKEGIKYYNHLINELLAKGLEPYVTIYHWDIPQALEAKYGGFLSHRVVDDFRDFANLCFKEFGDRVKYWITINEPYIYTSGGYAQGMLAPFRCSSWQNMNCTGGDSATEPYLVAHNMLLAHAAVVQLYKQKYQAAQKGIIGITHQSEWMVPYSNSKQDHDAASRALDFILGWFMDPLTNGDYPHSMRTLVGKRLPKFTKKESELVKGSYDFIGLNYYTANYAAYAPENNSANKSYLTDPLVSKTVERNGVFIGPQSGSSWLYVYPRGISELLLYIKEKYSDPIIYITENGVSEVNNATLSLKEALVDTQRIEYYHSHLWHVRKAMGEGVKVKGYFAWSLLDVFEWNSGFTVRFGIHFVDYKNGLKRYPKLSVHWFKNFLKK